MRIIINTIENKDNLTFICAETCIGEIKGFWRDKIIPEIGGEYFVELSIDNVCNLMSRSYYENISYSVMIKSNEVFFIGCCESMDEEVYYIRFDMDWLEMIEIPDNDPKIEEGDYVSFSAKYTDIFFYPYEMY